MIDLELTLIRGDGLAAKDMNIFGKLRYCLQSERSASLISGSLSLPV